MFFVFFCIFQLIHSVCVPSYFAHSESSSLSTSGEYKVTDEIIFGEELTQVSITFSDFPEDFTSASVDLEVMDTDGLPQVFALIRGDLSNGAYTDSKAGPILLENEVGTTFETPDLTEITKEVMNSHGYSGEITFSFALFSSPGSLRMTPMLKLTTCQEYCETLNFCCQTAFDGSYVKQEGSNEIWQRHGDGYAIWLEEITAFDGVAVNEQRWVIGSTSEIDAPLLVSDRTDENTFPALQGVWFRFDSMEALGSPQNGESIDCALQWGECPECTATKPPTESPSVSFPSQNPTTNPSFEPSEQPSVVEEKSCALKVEVKTCNSDDSSDLGNQFELEVCSDNTGICNVYGLGNAALEYGGSYSKTFPEDDIILEADMVQLVSSNDEMTCASLTITHGGKTETSDQQYIGEDCDAFMSTNLVCPCGSFPYQGYVTSCKTFTTGTNSVHQYVLADKETFLTSVPTSTKDFTLSVESPISFELVAYAGVRDMLGECIIGSGCIIDPSDQDNFNVQGNYNGMTIWYSGVSSRGWYSVIIADVNEEITLQLRAVEAGFVEIHLSYGEVSECNNLSSECAVCNEADWSCPEGQTAFCGGEVVPSCVAEPYAQCRECSDALRMELPVCSYDVNVEVIGLPTGVTVEVTNGEDSSTAESGTTTLVTTGNSEGDDYEVVVSEQPDGYVCSVNNGVGTMPADDVTVQVVCVEEDPCSSDSNPCQNGSICYKFDGSVGCACLYEFTGQFCEIAPTECSCDYMDTEGGPSYWDWYMEGGIGDVMCPSNDAQFPCENNSDYCVWKCPEDEDSLDEAEEEEEEECMGLTTSSDCMSEESFLQCTQAFQECGHEILILESCPVQFECPTAQIVCPEGTELRYPEPTDCATTTSSSQYQLASGSYIDLATFPEYAMYISGKLETSSGVSYIELWDMQSQTCVFGQQEHCTHHTSAFLGNHFIEYGESSFFMYVPEGLSPRAFAQSTTAGIFTSSFALSGSCEEPIPYCEHQHTNDGIDDSDSSLEARTCTCYSGALPQDFYDSMPENSIRILEFDSLFDEARFPTFDSIYLSNSELLVRTSSGDIHRTCIGYDSGAECDPSDLVCPSAGASVSQLLIEISAINFMHPSCPTSCHPLDFSDYQYYQTQGISEFLCK